MKKYKIFICAGEHSGDFLGSELIKAISKEIGDGGSIIFQGIGGNLMEQEGLVPIFDLSRLSVMGLKDIFTSIVSIFSILNRTVSYIIAWKPDVVITIDAPEFNLRLSSKIRKKWKTAKIIHYVVPSVWAWREGRTKEIKKNLDHMLALLPFEPDFLKRHGISCDFVGHPICSDSLPTTRDVISFKKSLEFKSSAKIVTVLPGSRIGEVKRMLPIFFKVMKLLKKEFPNIEFVCPTPKVVVPVFNFLKGKYKVKITHIDSSLLTSQDFEVMKKSLYACSDMAIATSGTVSLELARGGVPMIICYKTGFFTTLLYKLFIKVKSANLINIITNRQDVPEFLFERCTPLNIFKESKKILTDKSYAEKQLMASREAIRSLGYGSLHPATRAAKSVLNHLKIN